MRRLFSFCLLFASLAGPLTAQDVSCPCLEDDCGDILSSFTIIGEEAVVCDGFEFTVSNTSPTNDFDYFIWNWDDGTADTTFTKDPVNHTYFIPDSLVCSDDKTNFNICLIVVRECGEGYSCHSTQQPVSVIHRPEALFEIDPQICLEDGVNINNLSCNGEDFFWDFGDGNTSTDENPNHMYDAPGFYQITLEVSNECESDTYSQFVEVVAQPSAGYSSSIMAGDSLCAPATVSFSDETNQSATATVWSVSPMDTALWVFTDTAMSVFSDEIEILFLQPGTYTLELTASNVCGTDTQMEEIIIYEQPIMNLITPPVACDSAVIDLDALNYTAFGDLNQFQWTFTNGSVPGSQQEDFGQVVFYESGTVQLEASGPCDALTDQVPVSVAITQPISLAGNPASICENDAPLQLQADPPPPQGSWSGPGNAVSSEGMLDPSQLAPGTYTFTYSTGADSCSNEAAFDITIEPAVSVTIDPVSPACEDLSFTPGATVEGSGLTYSWTFGGASPGTSTDSLPAPISITQPDTFNISLVVTGNCGTAADTVEVVVQASQEVAIDAVGEPLCEGGGTYALTASVNGGTWSGNGIVDAENGVFDPQEVGPGMYEVVYTLDNGACVDQDTVEVEVVASEMVSVQNAAFCIDEGLQQLEALPTGGQWSGPGVSANGVFNPVVAAPDTHTLTYAYTDANGCEIQAEATVEVQALPTLAFDPVDSLCISDVTVNLEMALNAAGAPSDGDFTWSGPGVQDADGTFNTVNLSAGNYTITVTYDQGLCTVADSFPFTLFNAVPLELSPDTAVCITDGPMQLGANLPGGQWTGEGIDTLTGLIELPETGGAYDYLYAYAAGTTCAQEASVEVNIIDLTGAITIGPDESVCEGTATYELATPIPANGVWQGPGITDPATGTIDLVALAIDSTYTFEYCIESENAEGCQACDNQSFIIHPLPDADFSLEGLPCIGETFTLQNTSGGAVSYNWDLGDGANTTEDSPSHTYAAPGTYQVVLEAASAFGCTDQADTSLYITTAPEASFTLDETEGCAPFEVQVSNFSTGDSIQQFWQVAGDTLFGPGLEGVILDSIITDSVFEILLTVQNFCGPDTQVAEVLVHPYPMASFGVNADEGCSPFEVDFANTTLGEAENFIWDMGNGNTYTDSLPPNQVYTTTDTAVATYPVSLIAVNACGIDTAFQEVTVLPPDVRAFIQMDTLSGCSPLILQLAQFSTPGAQNSWLIEAPSGAQTGSALPNPIVTLEEPGVHTILLYASGCGQDVDTAYVEVLPAPEQAFDFPSQACIGEAVAFENLSEGISGSIWSFGDGTVLEGHSPTHTFDTAGVYEVTLTVYSLIDNCPATVSAPIVVLGTPASGFEPSVTSGCAPLTVDFTNTSGGAGGLDFVWDFGDGSSASFEPEPMHTFTSSGTFSVRLTATDDQNCSSDSTFLSITVHPDPVSAFSFAEQDYCLGHDTLVLINSSVDAVSYEWALMDTLLTTEEGAIMPDAPGAYPIQLIVQNATQCADTSMQEVVFLPSPEARFSFGPDSGCEDLAVSFSNGSMEADSYAWNFGNGNTSTLPDPTQLFTESGAYGVQLVALNFNGCPSDTLVQEVVVYPRPLADFSFEPPANCGAPQEVVFENLSLGQANNNWYFGDGSSTDVTAPTHLYEEPGEYEITLAVANEFGCLDTLRQVVDILGRPEAGAQLSVNEGCAPLYVETTNLSQQAQTYTWIVESQPEVQALNPAFLLEAPGLYDVQLVAVYNEDCVDTLVLQDAITVHETPNAAFDYNIDPLESLLGDVLFYNFSQRADRYLWDLGDGQTTIAFEPIHQYDFNGNIEVQLTAFNDNGGAWTCTDTTTEVLTPEWITTFHAPNALSPEYGEEGVRIFKPVGIGIEEYAIAIYSPYGEQVWYSNKLEDFQPAEGWDGYYKGALLPQGVYTWRADITFLNGDRLRRTGTVTLLR